MCANLSWFCLPFWLAHAGLYENQHEKCDLKMSNRMLRAHHLLSRHTYTRHMNSWNITSWWIQGMMKAYLNEQYTTNNLVEGSQLLFEYLNQTHSYDANFRIQMCIDPIWINTLYMISGGKTRQIHMYVPNWMSIIWMTSVVNCIDLLWTPKEGLGLSPSVSIS